jgi:hypothetical protein
LHVINGKNKNKRMIKISKENLLFLKTQIKFIKRDNGI